MVSNIFNQLLLLILFLSPSHLSPSLYLPLTRSSQTKYSWKSTDFYGFVDDYDLDVVINGWTNKPIFSRSSRAIDTQLVWFTCKSNTFEYWFVCRGRRIFLLLLRAKSVARTKFGMLR